MTLTLTLTAAGRLNVKQEEIDDMLKEAPGPVNFTVFLTMFGEKLKGAQSRKCWKIKNNDVLEGIRWLHLPFSGADPEETILNAFKVFDPEGKGVLRKD